VITRLEAYRYRCFADLVVDLGSYQVLAGPNGSGKTTLLDIPALLGDLLAVRSRTCSDAFLQVTESRGVPRAADLAELVHMRRGDRGRFFAFAVEAALPDHVRQALAGSLGRLGDIDDPRVPAGLRYELGFQVFNQELQVAGEHLFLFPERTRPERARGLQGGGSGRPSWRRVISRPSGEPAEFTGETSRRRPEPFRVPPDQLALINLPYDRQLYPAATWFQELLGEGCVFLEPDWRLLHLACPPGQPPRLLASGRNLPWLLLALQQDDPERYSDWVDHVRTALPHVDRIDAVEREEDHHAYIRVRYRGGHQVTSSGLSDGTLRILALTSVAYLRNLPKVFVTEEPENGIHPRGIEAILQSLTSVYGGQVWISTHSPFVLAHTGLDAVLAMQIKDGEVKVVRGREHLRLREWRGEVDLGTLFAAGVLE
jgi:energy-coupling factor transporter ATP-binding protein EcfA2